jgi:hypothetical protein
MPFTGGNILAKNIGNLRNRQIFAQLQIAICATDFAFCGAKPISNRAFIAIICQKFAVRGSLQKWYYTSHAKFLDRPVKNRAGGH